MFDIDLKSEGRFLLLQKAGIGISSLALPNLWAHLIPPSFCGSVHRRIPSQQDSHNLIKSTFPKIKFDNVIKSKNHYYTGENPNPSLDFLITRSINSRISLNNSKTQIGTYIPASTVLELQRLIFLNP